jgi:hypothetical protein
MEAILVRTAPMTTHPARWQGQLRALRRPQRESLASPVLFVPVMTAGFARMIERAAAAAGIELKVQPHILRHVLANNGRGTRAMDGSAILRSPAAVHTALAPNRFKDFWRD